MKPLKPPRTAADQSNILFGAVWACIGFMNTIVFVLRLANDDGLVITSVVGLTVAINFGLSAHYFYLGRRKPLVRADAGSNSEGKHA